MSLSGHQSAHAKSDEWLTPPEWLRALGEFDLDPCAPVNRPWDTAREHFTIVDNGLTREWRGRVWCNPPFGREAAKWLRRMAEHDNGIALIPARTETAMFYESVWAGAEAVCFVRGRPHFHYVDGRRAPFNSGAPICLVAYGRRNAYALLDSNLGHVVQV
ncbi:adenine methyltransferase [Burkholderia ubonensis]|uniref:Adenine methyltransferase n=1 Tax=Burkholderia ubonensis TaxID=101571 RepID=A0A118HLL2_9BURK|nr:DNA N-6-adenine-methyltransferase [Burkholderia ubonensis]AOJ62468.1 adenine methyltransferase [Burkholderia ubonensis]KVG56431.1 adenine methyltransferase [Burkholderia ubonensis]